MIVIAIVVGALAILVSTALPWYYVPAEYPEDILSMLINENNILFKKISAGMLAFFAAFLVIRFPLATAPKSYRILILILSISEAYILYTGYVHGEYQTYNFGNTIGYYIAAIGSLILLIAGLSLIIDLELSRINSTILGIGLLILLTLILLLNKLGYMSESTLAVLGVLFLAVRIGLINLIVHIASKKNRSKLGWGIAGFISPAIVLIVISQLKNLKNDQT